MSLRPHARRTMVVVTVALVLLTASACGDDDNDKNSSGSTTTSTSANAGAIRQLQSELDTLGCGAGADDGKLGPETEAAIRQFQAAAGITVDGIVGVNTRNALSEAARTGAPDCHNTPKPPSTTTTTGGGSAQCTQPAITSGVTASASASGVTVGEYQCSGSWAEAQATTPGPNGFEYTALLHWTGSSWVSVDRGTYCENGDVPQAIYQAACESN